MFVSSKVSPFVRVLAAGLLLDGGFPGAVHAGSFLQEEGQGQAIYSWRRSGSDLAYDSEGYLVSMPSYVKHEQSLLLEYGFTRDMTLIFKPSLANVRLEDDPRGHADGLGSLEAGARWRLLDIGRSVLSLQATARIPMRSDPFFALENRPRTELRLGFGQPARIWGREGFLDSGLSLIKRQEALPDEVKVESSAGVWLRPNQMFLVQVFTTFWPGTSKPMTMPRQNKVEVSTVYKLGDEWSFQLGTFWANGGFATRRDYGTFTGLWRSF